MTCIESLGLPALSGEALGRRYLINWADSSEEIVKTILAVALVASQTTYYEAKVTSFGCTSIEAVSQLQKVRSDQNAFQAALVEKQMYGECVTILQGTLVQGSIETTDNSILRVNQQVEPPGYEAPRMILRSRRQLESRNLQELPRTYARLASPVSPSGSIANLSPNSWVLFRHRRLPQHLRRGFLGCSLP